MVWTSLMKLNCHIAQNEWHEKGKEKEINEKRNQEAIEKLRPFIYGRNENWILMFQMHLNYIVRVAVQRMRFFNKKYFLNFRLSFELCRRGASTPLSSSSLDLMKFHFFKFTNWLRFAPAVIISLSHFALVIMTLCLLICCGIWLRSRLATLPF